MPHSFAMSASISSIAIAGLQAASARFGAHARNIANQQSEGYRPLTPVQSTDATGAPVVRTEQAAAAQQRLPGTDFVVPQSDLATEMVGTIESGAAYKASAALLKTSQELDKALLDVIS